MPSAFVRKAPAQTPAVVSRAGGASSTTSAPIAGPSTPRFWSTGIPSFDDILGGGLPVGSFTSILTPDPHSAWSLLIARHFIAQGLSTNQEVIILSPEEPWELVKGCMWTDALPVDDESEGEGVQPEDTGRTRIAWRYDKMAKFKTTIQNNNSNLNLTKTIPEEVIEKAKLHKALVHVRSFKELGVALAGKGDADVRVLVDELGGFNWSRESVDEKWIHRRLRRLHSLLGTNACAMVTFPPELARSSPSQAMPTEAWIDSLAWSSANSGGGCFEFQGFADDPALPISFPHSHGLVHPYALPSPCTTLPPAYRRSTLLGLGVGSSGQNNLSFRLKRKRFVVETLHLGVEGGVGERRTEPPPLTKSSHSHSHKHAHDTLRSSAGHSANPSSREESVSGVETPGQVQAQSGKTRVKFAALNIQPEADGEGSQVAAESDQVAASKPKKERKKVSFHKVEHDKPELYDF